MIHDRVHGAAVALTLCMTAMGSHAYGQDAPGPKSPPLPPPRPAIEKAEEAKSSGPGAEFKNAVDGDTESQTCLSRIAQLGARFQPRARLQDGSCGGDEIVVLSGVSGGVAIAPPATMACPVAEALSRWSADTLAPAAERHLQQTPTRILISTSYECRNQRSGEKLSEHAFANAVDVMGFEFGKRGPLAIGNLAEGSTEAAFQDAVRKGACVHFTTVLGPGSDASHSDHLHLDLRGRKGAFRICQ